MIKGKEFVGVTDKTNCSTCVEYNSDTDLEFMDIKVKEEYQILNEGDFLIFYPTDSSQTFN